MSYTLQYKYKAGEFLRYEHEANLMIDLPGGEQMVGTSTYEQIQEIQDETDGRWKMVSRQRLLSGQGELAPPEGVGELEPQTFLMDPTGAAFHLGDGSPLCPASLPLDPVDVGSRWRRIEPAANPASPPLVTECMVQSIEMEGEDRVVTMAAVGRMPGQDDDGPHRTEIKGVTRFSENRGCLLSSDTVVTIQWENGRKAVTALEIALKERG